MSAPEEEKKKIQQARPQPQEGSETKQSEKKVAPPPAEPTSAPITAESAAKPVAGQAAAPQPVSRPSVAPQAPQTSAAKPQPPGTPTAVPARPTPAAVPSTPAAAPRPATPGAPTAAPPARPPPRPPIPTTPPVKVQRRPFLKLLALLGGVATITPFIPYGEFAYSALGAKGEKQKIILPDGKVANVNTFSVNSSSIFVYPRTGDLRLDSEPFRRYQLVRLPKEFGGDKNDGSSFRAYSMICVHLWCLWNYRPLVIDPSGKQQKGTGECPCHGSVYNMLTGKAILGPASLQPPPSNALANLDLEIDSDGNIYALPPDTSADKNGVVGYGRYVS